MNLHATIYLVLGAAFISLNWLSTIGRRRFQYLPMHFIYVVVGAVLFYFVLGDHLPDPLHSERDAKIMEYGSELILIISLLTCGIAIDRRLTVKDWKIPIRLLSVAMPITIVMVGVLAAILLNFSLVEACLIAACLSPTDPVLAGEVKVNPPNEGGESEDRFGLTAEAGLNDGLAFPFVHLALGIGLHGLTSTGLMEWAAYDVVYRILIGTFIGIGVGYGIAHYAFKQTDATKDPESAVGLVTVAAVFLSYGLAEICSGYGFLAVFAAALTGRHREKQHAFHKRPYHFAKQLEELLLGLLLLGLGGLLINYWDTILTWRNALFALVLILLIRPLSGYIGLLRTPTSLAERNIISFFGIRGMGSIYYLAYAHTHIEGGVAAAMWGPILLTILASVLIHGITSGMLTGRFKKLNSQEINAKRPSSIFKSR